MKSGALPKQAFVSSVSSISTMNSNSILDPIRRNEVACVLRAHSSASCGDP